MTSSEKQRKSDHLIGSHSIEWSNRIVPQNSLLSRSTAATCWMETNSQTNCSTAVWRVLETWQNKKHLAKCKLMSAARSADIYPFSKQIFSFYSHKSHEIYYACTNITVRSIIIARDVPFYTVILLIIFLPKGGCMKTYSVWKHTVMTVIFFLGSKFWA